MLFEISSDFIYEKHKLYIWFWSAELLSEENIKCDHEDKRRKTVNKLIITVLYILREVYH